MPDTLKIALFQMDVAWEDPARNLARLREGLPGASSADLVVLPELFLTGFTMQVSAFAETMSGPVMAELQVLADHHDFAIGGSMIIREDERYHNRFVFVAPGEAVRTYDKRHLFRMGEEPEHYSAGDRKVIVSYRGWRILPLVCYDVRFPVWSRYDEDYDMLVYVANWPAVRRAHWDCLLRARAIENQAYVLGVNRVGPGDGGLRHDGGTCVIDPRGHDQARAEDDVEAWVKADISLAEVRKARERFPVWKDRDPFVLR